MQNKRNSNSSQNEGTRSHDSNSLLIVACSQRKIESSFPVPAIHLYDGVNYRLLRKIFRERGWPPGLQIKIISAKYGLIDASTLIEPYDLRLDKAMAREMNETVLSNLKDIPTPSEIFVNLGKDYTPAIDGIETIFPNSRMVFAEGGIGRKLKAMKEWLKTLNYYTASIIGISNNKRSYLYFFPDWDDYVYEPFTPDEKKVILGKRTYAHELSGDKVPFDGVLLSLSHIKARKGPLHWLTNNSEDCSPMRDQLRIPNNLLLFGDCGAFSYVNEDKPPFTVEYASQLYDQLGFDIAASVDHIPIPEIRVVQSNGSVKKRVLSESERLDRMYLSQSNAEEFLRLWKDRRYRFTPLGVMQGIDTQSYVARLHDYIDMGYEHIALGGLVPQSDSSVLEIVSAVRQGLQERTRGGKNNIWLHLFGILRPKLQPIFKNLGVSSFDSASYFRKAWLRSSQNYLAPDGRGWYGTIRIPYSSSKAMRLAADSAGISYDELVDLEESCLSAIQAYSRDRSAEELVMSSVDKYSPLLPRRGESNHFTEEHALLLKDRPWEKCHCPFCKSAGIHVVIFRGSHRNKRRGLHNTWIFYHKILHGNVIPGYSLNG